MPGEEDASLETKGTIIFNIVSLSVTVSQRIIILSYRLNLCYDGKKKVEKLLIRGWCFETIDFVGSTKVVTSIRNVLPSGSGYIGGLWGIERGRASLFSLLFTFCSFNDYRELNRRTFTSVRSSSVLKYSLA